MINKINSSNFAFKSNEISEAKTAQTVTSDKTEPVKRIGLLDKFETQIRNSADLNDTIKVPRTIFKGYLSIMVGSAILSVTGFIKDKYPKAFKGLNIAASALMLFGTYAFVRPYIIKSPETK